MFSYIIFWLDKLIELKIQELIHHFFLNFIPDFV